MKQIPNKTGEEKEQRQGQQKKSFLLIITIFVYAPHKLLTSQPH